MSVNSNEHIHSIAQGAKLTADSFNDFVNRLTYHSRGDGANDHCTADALFIVQARRMIVGIDEQYTDTEQQMIIRDDESYMSPNDYWESLDTSEKIQLNKLAQELTQSKTGFLKSPRYIQWEILENLEDHRVVGWIEKWEYVNAHFTKEAAEAFILRKKHDYPDGIRIYVDAQIHCWEFNTIKNAIMDGKLVFKD